MLVQVQRAPNHVLAARGCVDDLEAFALLGGALAQDRVAEIVAHVDACTPCHELIEGLCAPDTDDTGRSDAARAPRVDPMIGKTLADAYRVDALLATGGMGRVYRATDLALERPVAIKIPRSRSPWLLRRFEREVAITARLGHPGIVPIHTAGRLADGTPFYAMSIIDGVPLDVALARAANREQRLALVPHVVAVANTMAFVHGEAVMHRDLKPQNVLIGAFGQTLIIDWGLAKELAPTRARLSARAAAPVADVSPTIDAPRVLAGRTTRPGDVLGTPAFMSPEQARGELVDQRSDVYALGAILEHLLTGRLPRKAADAALLHAPPELVAICRKAMAHEPDARYADCGELAAELRTATAVRAMVAHPIGHVSRRWPVAAAIGAGIAIGVAVSQLGGW